MYRAALVVIFGISPTETWTMTPHDYWTLHRFKFPEKEGMDREEFEKLKERYDGR